MKKLTNKTDRRLVIRQETVRRLSNLDMRGVLGGYQTSDGGNCTTLARDCPTTSDYTQGYCTQTC